MNTMTRFNNGFFPTLMSDMFFGDLMPKVKVANHNTPAMNVTESENSYDVEFAAPGMTKDDFSIRLTDDNLMEVKMEKKSSTSEGNDKECAENQGTKYLRKEFSYETYCQSFTLPDNINYNDISASMTDGILHMPGGQSGHPLSPFWGAGHDDWVQGRATPFLPGPPRHTLALRP